MAAWYLVLIYNLAYKTEEEWRSLADLLQSQLEEKNLALEQADEELVSARLVTPQLPNIQWFYSGMIYSGSGYDFLVFRIPPMLLKYRYI